MQTKAIILAALATTSFAQQRSNVHLGTEIAFRTDINNGVQSNPEVPIDACFNLPQEYWLRLTSISPNGDIKCNIYSGPDCTGVTQTGGWVDRQVDNLALAPWFFDNRAFSLFCTRR